MIIKICGITKPKQALAIAQMGVDYLGYICVPASPRFINPEQVAEITDILQDYKLGHVGVFLDADMAKIAAYIEIANINSIQLHGNESVEFCQELRSEFPEIKLIKAFRVKNQQILSEVISYTNYVDVVLLDAYDPQLAGGTGKTLDWSMLQDFSPSCDWWLAGGLSCQNIEAAIAQLQPNGVDISSGVENSPGDKNLDQVRDLIKLLTFKIFAAN